MSTPFLGEVRIVAFNFAPKGYAFCNGQTLPINQNQALFALLGTTYGGNGITTFALPNMQSRFPVHFGQGPGLTNRNLGDVGGEEFHTVSMSEMPAHTHVLAGSTKKATLIDPTGNVWAADALGHPYNTVTDGTSMDAQCTTAVGGGQPHENLQPLLVVNMVIALQGIFPSRS